MKKLYNHLLPYCLALGFVATSSIGFSQMDTVTIGTGTSVTGTYDTGPTPFGTYYHDGKNQILYTVAEISASGSNNGWIKSIAFDVNQLAGQTMNGMEVKIKSTSATSLSAWVTGFTTVYSGNYTPTTGWNYIDFNMPYFWDGSDNLIVQICFNNNGYTDNNLVNYHVTTNMTNVYGYSDSGTPDPCSSEGQDGVTDWRPNTRFVIEQPFTNDAGVAQLDSPTFPACNLGNNVYATLYNYGASALTTATINWELNGTAQTPVSWTGNLATGQSEVVFIGTTTISSGDTLQLWSSAPNGGTEPASTQAYTDSTYAIIKTGLSGSYFITQLTISGPTVFHSFTEAVDELAEYGLCGPVTFYVDDNTSNVYNEQINIPDIQNSSSTNTITFTTAMGNASNVELTYTPTSGSDNYTVQLSGADYVTFKKMTVSTGASSTYEGRVFWIHGSSNHNTFDSLVVNGDPSSFSTWTSESALFGSESDIDSNNVFTNNTMTGGAMGFYLYGSGPSGLEPNTVISNNTHLDYYAQGISMNYQENLMVSHNEFVAQIGGYMWSSQWNFYYCNTPVISHNTFTCEHDGYGLTIDNATSTIANPGYVYNNIVSIGGSSTGEATGLQLYGNNNLKIHSNSMYVYSGSGYGEGVYVSGGLNNEFLNNNVYVDGNDPAIYMNGGLSASNYNNLYSSGSIGSLSGNQQATLADWQAVTNYDLNSVSTDPNFPSFTDLTTCNDTLNDVGIASAMITDDYAGTGRSGIVDIGAFEFDGVNSFSLGADTSICNGTTLVLGNPNSNSTWAWNTSATTNTISVNSAGIYTAQITNSCGIGNATIEVMIEPDAVADFTYNDILLGVLFTSTSSNAFDYHWDFGDGDTSVLENPDHVYTSGGTYTVVLTVTGPCGTDTYTEQITVGVTGITEQGIEFSMVPNPASDVVRLQSSESLSGSLVEIIDATGRTIYSETSSNNIINLDVSTYESGTYFIRVTGDNKTGIQKLIVR